MKKFFCFTLILVMLIPIFACGDGENKTNDKPIDDTGTINETTSNRLYPNVPDVNYKDAEFKIIGTADAVEYGSGYYATKDVWTDEMDGEPFNDAIFERNRAVEERLGIKIVYSDSNNVKSTVSNIVLADEYEYDLTYGSSGDMVFLSKGGSLINMKTMKYLNLDNPWWDSAVIEQVSIANKVYYLTGDLSFMVNDCTRLIYFNKKLIEMYGLTSPYEYVHKNDWTLDNFSILAKSVYNDMNGDGLFNDGDRFGLYHESGTPDTFFFGAEQTYTKLDKDGYPQVYVMNDKTFKIIEDIFNLIYDKNACINIFDLKNAPGYKTVYTYGRALFAQDLMLFALAGTLVLNEFRDMESEFGMAPVPKYSSDQESYGHYVDSQSNFVCVPKTALDFERTAIVMEVMAAESRYIMKPVYYDQVLQRKYLRDNESSEMLDIIYASRILPVGITESLGSFMSVMLNAYNGKKIPLASDFEKVMDASLAAIEKTYNVYLELE